MTRLGLFIDARFRVERSPQRHEVYCGSEVAGFMRFSCAVGSLFDHFRIIARETSDADATPYPLPQGPVLSGLPDYPSLRDLRGVATALPRTVRPLWCALDGLDVVWVSGVHPVGLLLAVLAKVRGVRVVLLIRQDSPQYFRSRLPSSRWRPVLLPLRGLDLAFRALALRSRATVVGADVARRYGAPRPNVLQMHVILLERSQLAASPRLADWSSEVVLLTVGRVEPEKNPLLLVDALATLQRGGTGDYRLLWAGEGRLEGAVRSAAASAGIESRVELLGYVPFGRPLIDLYRRAHAFVHVALTEGEPQVIREAMGSGLPIVATDVGGVAEALANGTAGLLVPPSDARAIAGAVERLRADHELRERLATRALEVARGATLESEADRVAEFMRS
jgi:glycosyltransferase involved in cell wall biosynthesis